MVIEELLKGEVADALGRQAYERREEAAAPGYRNGYKTRKVKTGEGAILVDVPQVRGMTITTDGAPGLIKAVEGMWPESARLRCWFHKMKNVLEKVPENMHGPIKALLARPCWPTCAMPRTMPPARSGRRN